MSTNSNYSLQLTASVSYTSELNEINFDFSFDPYKDCTDLEGLKELAIAELETQDDFKAEVEGINESAVIIEITDWDNVPARWSNDEDVWNFAEAFAENDQEVDVIEAAMMCEVSPSDIDKAYSGQFKDDEDFAYDMAESTGAIDKNSGWPNNCINWEKAARELMYDYSSHNGYYFRNL